MTEHKIAPGPYYFVPAGEGLTAGVFRKCEYDRRRYDIQPDDTITIAVNQPNIIDLSSMVGNTEILFEFSEPLYDFTNKTPEQEYHKWREGYLGSISDGSKHPFDMGHRVDNVILSGDCFQYCRFQTDRIYPWFGGECPLPEGLKGVIWFRQRYGSAEEYVKALDKYYWEDFGINNQAEITAFQILGPAEGWKYAWE